MRVRLAIAGLALLASAAKGQSRERMSLILEPGFLTASALSAPEGAATLTAFYVRALVLTGSESSRWRGLLGVSTTPFGFRGSGVRNQNAPAVFGGLQVEVLADRLTGGWLSLYVPLLMVYSYRGGATDNTRLYGADAAAEMTVLVRLGAKLFGDLGQPWSRLGAYVSMFQNLTPNVEASSGKRDRWRPDFMYGVSIPLIGTR